ncbi:alpha-tectorin-like [Centropristis striata]|uniref:alpha-tectorin-like n=1 Tax=Centropristis striata TaxID=184440 RepID=UPI0027DEBBEB|nr:alpha-tectorin-like [Centropristis striata]
MTKLGKLMILLMAVMQSVFAQNAFNITPMSLYGKRFSYANKISVTIGFGSSVAEATASTPRYAMSAYFGGTYTLLTCAKEAFLGNITALRAALPTFQSDPLANLSSGTFTISLATSRKGDKMVKIQLVDFSDGQSAMYIKSLKGYSKTLPPFNVCNAEIPPEHYVSSCNQTMCNYPAMDEVYCQSIKAYAQACSMLLGMDLDWESTTNCSSDAFCPEKYCSGHEFCGNKKSGEPTVCDGNSATVAMAECLLVDHGIDHSRLHLNDPTCTGDYDEQSHMVSFIFTSSNLCGTEIVKNNSQIIYKNSIVSKNVSAHEVITRHDQIEIDFSCFYNQPERKSVSFKIKDSSVVETIVSGIWNYTLNMSAYTDPGLMERIGPNTEIRLDQKIWVELKTTGLDEKLLAIVTDSCWATNLPSPDGPRYDLIKKGCPNKADETVMMQGNGVGLSNSFSFNMFEFVGGSNEIFLHCLVELCPKDGPACAPVSSRVVKSIDTKTLYPDTILIFKSIEYLKLVITVAVSFCKTVFYYKYLTCGSVNFFLFLLLLI